LGLNTPPLGAVKTGGTGDLFPRIRKDFKGKSSIPRRLRRGFLLEFIDGLPDEIKNGVYTSNELNGRDKTVRM
jgi:hypothetical protein